MYVTDTIIERVCQKNLFIHDAPYGCLELHVATQCVNRERFSIQRWLSRTKSKLKTAPIFLSEIQSRFNIVLSGVSLKQRVWTTNCDRGTRLAFADGVRTIL